MSYHPYRSLLLCLYVFTGIRSLLVSVITHRESKCSVWLAFQSCWNRCAVFCSVTNKESKSFPPTQQGDFQPHVSLKSDSKRREVGKRWGSDFPFFSTILSHSGQRKFTFHHKATLLLSLICWSYKKQYGFIPAAWCAFWSRICSKTVIVWTNSIKSSKYEFLMPTFTNHPPLIQREHVGGLYSAQVLSASVSRGEDSKRFVRRRALVNNLTIPGVKGQGSCIHWKTLLALLGCRQSEYFLTFQKHTQTSSHKFTQVWAFCLLKVPTKYQSGLSNSPANTCSHADFRVGVKFEKCFLICF